tara:strand:+ start:112 stop:312 length:201 start_codon:yes stop_codon:yes gene_type:complete
MATAEMMLENSFPTMWLREYYLQTLFKLLTAKEPGNWYDSVLNVDERLEPTSKWESVESMAVTPTR